MLAVDDDVRESRPLQHQQELVPEVEAEVDPVLLLGLQGAVAPALGVHLERHALLERVELEHAGAQRVLGAVGSGPPPSAAGA